MDLLALLCVLGICSSLALGNDIKSSPPEDLDGSGDDEDYSGSGASDVFVAKVVDMFSTPSSPLTSTVVQLSTAQLPVIAVEEDTEADNATKPVEATEHESMEDLAVVPIHESSTEEHATLQPTTQQIPEESDFEKGHHHHHHHHHPHHHTTTPESITTTPAEAEKPLIVPEESATSTPDESEADAESVVQKVSPTAEDSVHVVHHQETTSGSSSTPYADNEGTTTTPLVVDEFPIFVDSKEKTTEADDAHKGHHHHHHRPHHTTAGTTTTSPADGLDTLILEETSDPSDKLEPEEVEATTTPPDDDKRRHPHHHHHPHHPTTTVATSSPADESDTFIGGEELEPEEVEEPNTTPSHVDKHHHHHPHHHNHTTAPATTQSTETKPALVHTQQPKGRMVNVPLAETTASIPETKDEEHFPGDVQENLDDTVSSTVQYKDSVAPNQDEDAVDSKEDRSSGDGVPDVDDFVFEPTVGKEILRDNKIEQVPDSGSSDAAHGIMDKKELLAGIIAGGIAGLVFAACLVAFVFYRMKKKDEGSYSLEEPKQSNGGYQKPREQREFYA